MARNDPPRTSRGMKEALARVLEDPSRERFRDMLREHTGEAPNLDFKERWPDGEKVAKHVLAMANSGGGCIVVGVAERSDKQIEPVGLTAFRDKADFTKRINRYLPDSLTRNVFIDDFAYQTSDYAALSGRMFQLISVIPEATNLPYVSEREGTQTRVAAVYVRRGTESVEANQEELQRIINARIETGHSTTAAMDLGDHLDQLKVLQDRIPQFTYSGGWTLNAQLLSGMTRTANADYPKEDMAAFVRRVFEAKKALIERELGLDLWAGLNGSTRS